MLQMGDEMTDIYQDMFRGLQIDSYSSKPEIAEVKGLQMLGKEE